MPWGQPLSNLWQLGDEQREVLWNGRSLPMSSQNLTRQVFERGQTVYSDLYYGVHVQQPRLALAVPVVRQGKVRYALVLSVAPALLDQLIRSAVNAPGLRAVLVDRRGIVVATNEAAAARLGDKATPIPVAPGSTTGHYEIKVRDGAHGPGRLRRVRHQRFRGAGIVAPASGPSGRPGAPSRAGSCWSLPRWLPACCWPP